MALLTIFLIGSLQAAAGGGRAAVVFERAATVPERYVDVHCALYDRNTGTWCTNQAGAELNPDDFTAAELESLTRHADPRVRTLALLKIAQRVDPRLLPAVFALVTDKANTYSAHTPVAMIMHTDYSKVPKTPQTVGQVAEHVLDFYLEPAGYSYGAQGTRSCPGFPHYWERRKDRTALASWFTAELYRATQRSSPIRSGRERQFAALRRRIDQLTGDERLWYSLHIGASEGGHRVFTEAETVAAAQAIGPERLMEMIHGKGPAFDPDLVFTDRPGGCSGNDASEPMRRFVLEHSAQLLRAPDADGLVTRNEQHALWAIAAVALRPDRAAAILKPRIETISPEVFGWDQARMAAALVHYGGAAHIPYALDWFYGRSHAETTTNAQEIFINQFIEKWTDERIAVLTRLVRDPRFDRISVPALRMLILRINRWLPAPLVADPYGYLGEGREQAETVARWRRLVQESVPNWK
jgi:hypothetical protein